MKDLNIAIYPQPIVWGDKNANIRKLESAVNCLPEETDLLVIPETFSTGFPVGMTSDEVERIAELVDGHTMQSVKYLAFQNNIAIAGSFICKSSKGLTNRSFFVFPDGSAEYADKRHLFSMGGENRIFKQGDKRFRIYFKGWKIALAVCYDLRFPVWNRNDKDDPYDLLLFVANWPEVRIDAWEKLLYARAIENLSYVAGVDCLGTDPSDHFYNGKSLIIDYMGRTLAESSSESLSIIAPIITAKLSKEKILKFREKFPAHLDSDSFKFL